MVAANAFVRDWVRVKVRIRLDLEGSYSSHCTYMQYCILLDDFDAPRKLLFLLCIDRIATILMGWHRQSMHISDCDLMVAIIFRPLIRCICL